jgi:putative hydrolase of the HAD superfamily
MFNKYLMRYEESWRLYPDVVPCLSALSKQKLGIISNGDSKQQRQKLESLSIIQYFSTVVVSGDIGIAKPDPLIFYAACEAANCPPNECFFIGNDLDIDAKGSISAGLRGIWLNREGHKQQEGIRAISSLKELKEKIELLNHRL